MCYTEVERMFLGRFVGDPRFRPDELLTSADKHYVDENPHIILPDPFASDDWLDDFSPSHQFQLISTEELNTMNTSDDEPSSGVNARLRPRKPGAPSPLTTKAFRRSESKSASEKPKRTSTPSKVLNKQDDLAHKSDSSPVPHFLCPYCDRKFAAKQAVSKHVRRLHSSDSKQDYFIGCLFCNHTEPDLHDIIRHMVDSHPNQYFACLDCHTRFPSTSELAEHKLNICEKQKLPYKNKLRQKSGKTKKAQKTIKIDDKEFQNDPKTYPTGFNGIVISCELKPSQVHDEADIEDNITTNLILPPGKTLGNNAILDKNAVILLDDIQWNKRIPSNFSFHNTDADQILSRLGVVHRSPRTGEPTKKDWLRTLDDATQKFEKCFDTSFYSKVASNVHENLTKFLDGSFNFNPDPDSTIKTRKSKNSVVINTAEGFPILLACEQFSRNTFDGYMPRAIAPKHKWKWDNLESDRTALSADQIKRDSHTNNCIITLVSSLDIWTQLCMRRKYEEKYSYSPLAKKTDKQTAIDNELKEILESRELPTSSSQVVKFKHKPTMPNEGLDFPASLGLAPSTPKYELPPAVLSGEWVRPRCFVCCACGAPTWDSRALSAHMATRHPNAQVQHYEVVGEPLLNSDILKHLYVPPNQMHNRTRPPRGYRECTKCRKSVTFEDLHQHMLDCAGDTPAVRRKCRHRPFGVRRRRPRLPDNRIRKKMRKDIRDRQPGNQKSHMRSRPKNRTEVGDAETIRKMLADLPAKRHRVLVNPTSSGLRSRAKMDKQRNKLLMKRRLSEDPKKRKLRTVRNNSNYNEQSGSSKYDDQNKSSDDKNEDDLPLKRTVKRVQTKTTRQNEAMKRKVAINRAKRKLKSAEEAPTNNEIDPDTNVPSTSGAQPDELSIENTPQRVDINSGSYNTRENSNRGSSNSNNGSNNREQQPRHFEQNGNASRAPVPNTPLKHSIARLTADCETHDKSVQFHHSFLVQQECNNVNQHVPTGHQLLFENEAAVTRLDKPPLGSSHRGILDPYSLQKSKLNKPRKGLNDCIAMLKNKLVEPSSGLASTQISVQCGSDDPLDAEPLVGPTVIEDKHIDTTKPAEVFSRHNMNLEMERYREYSAESKLPPGRQPIPMPYEMIAQMPVMMPPEDANLMLPIEISSKQKTTKRQSSRRRSARSAVEPIPPFISPANEPLPAKRQSDRVSHRRSATQRIVVNINSEASKRSTLEMPYPNKVSPRQISPRPVMINTDMTKDQIVDKPLPMEFSPLHVSPKQVNINVDTHRSSRSRSESITKHPSRQTSQAHKQISPQSGNNDAKRLSPKQVSQALDIIHSSRIQVSPQISQALDISHLSQNQVSPKQLSHGFDITYSSRNQVSPKQMSQAFDINHSTRSPPKQLPDITHQSRNRVSPKQVSQTFDITRSSPSRVSPKQLSQSHDVQYSNKLGHKQVSPKQAFDAQTSSQLPCRQVNYALDSNRLTPKQAYPKQSSQTDAQSVNNLAPKQMSPKQISQAFDPQSYSKMSSSNLTSREVSPRLTSPRLVSPRQSLDINTDITFTRSKQTPSPRFTNQSISIEPIHKEDLRNAPARASSQGGSTHPRPPSQSQSSISSKQRSPSQPRDTSTQSQGPPIIYLYAPPPPPPPPPPPAASVSPQTMVQNQLESQSQQQWQSNVYHDIIHQNTSEISNEHSRTRKVSVEVYPETEFAHIPSDIPPAHASTIIEPLVSVPLDLSGKMPTVESCVSVSKQETSFANNYENYETLDLSNKKSGISNRDPTDVVVDLRVKPATQHSTRVPLEDCSISSKSVEKIAGHVSIPKDLSVKTKHVVSRNDTLPIACGTQDLSSQHTTQTVREPAEEIISVEETATDLSGKSTVSPRVDQTIHQINNNETLAVPITGKICQTVQEKDSVVVNNKDSNVNAPANLPEKSYETKQSEVLIATQNTSEKVIELTDNISQPTDAQDLDISNSMQKPVFDPTLKIPQYKIRVTTSDSQDIVETESTNDETGAQPEANLRGSILPNNNISMSSEKSFNLVSTPLNITNVASLPIYTLPNIVSSAHVNRHESTTPVYTLANACISVTKIDGTGVVPLTSTLLSIPSSTIANTTSVYTLANTTIGIPDKFGSKLIPGAEIPLQGSIQSNLHSQQVGIDNVSEIERQINAINKNAIETKKLKDEIPKITATNAEQDPETARKIAMLPKELVEILGTMPPGHRNQLLNVLPQYVSNTNAQVDGIQGTAAEASISSAVSKYGSPINYQNAMVTLPDNRFTANFSAQLNENFESDIKQSFPLLNSTKSPLEDVKPPMRTLDASGESKIEIINLGKSEINMTKLNETIIDLTEDDNPPSAAKTTENYPTTIVLQALQATQPIINLSSVTKTKVTNEKTSMLRAVRIKAPSERHKSMSTDLQVSKATNNLDSELAFHKTLAIQQSEVSSTQHQKKDAVKFPSQMSPVLTELTKDIEKPDKIQREISTDQIISEIETDNKIVGIKTVLVTSSISTKDLLTKDAVGKETVNQIIQNNIQNELAPSADAISESSDNEKQDTAFDTSIECSTLSGESKEKIGLDEHIKEDSDDDVSLAVIVKQKLLDQQINSEKVDILGSKNKLDRKKRRKDKKLKRSEKKAVGKQKYLDQITASVIKNDLVPNDAADNLDKTHVEDSPSNQNFINSPKSDIPLKDEEKHSKKKTRKSLRSKSLLNTTSDALDFDRQDMHEIVLEHDSVSSSSNITQKEKDEDDTKINSNVIIEKEVQQELEPESTASGNLSDDFKSKYEMSIFSANDDDSSHIYSKKEKARKKKDISKLSLSTLPIQGKEVDEIREIDNPEFEKGQNNYRDECGKAAEPDSCSLLELSDTQDSGMQESIEDDSNSKSDEFQKNKSDTRNKKVKKVEICAQTPEIQEQTMAPLRRSRRGKSLFVDIKPSDGESITESEQKTPLTKKQLIFSKLLLDEENTIPQAHSTSLNNPEKTEIITSAPEPSMDSNTNTMDVIQQQNKATKRRHSPQVKRKLKKSKPIENSPQIVEDSDTDSSFHVEKHTITVEVVAQPEIEKETMNSKNIGSSISGTEIEETSYSENKSRTNTDHLNKGTLSAEKRKCSGNSDLELNSKIKKCKLSNTVDTDPGIKSTVDKNVIDEDQDKISKIPEVRTTCYNKPVAAARRTRSKSAVVKSSGTLLYDPYDIDLDDMIERNEPVFIKKGRKSETKSSDHFGATPSPVKSTISKMPKKASVQSQSKTSIKQKKLHKEIPLPDKEQGNKVFEGNSMKDVRGNISDSDDSSKSDVPLQKYVEEKGKRVSDMDNVPSPEKDFDDDTNLDQGEFSGDKNNSNDSKSSRKTLAVCNNVEDGAIQSDTEEQLRSEQFMESFGFFSERKPRKSNLLASKKISETFHIIANESDDVYFGYKDRTTKKLQNENKKSADGEGSKSTQNSSNKKGTKRGRKKKSYVKPVPCYCNICKKEFKRSDNYLRHQMSLIHISKLSEVELKIKTLPIHEEPNYLIAYKQYLDRLKILTDKLAKKKKNKGSRKIKLPTVEEILADLNKTIREQQFSQRGELSRDEALFLDCCELLKESHKSEKPNAPDASALANLAQSSGSELLETKQIIDDTKSDGDVDSITAKNILESEEVRNLENDLISGLKEAANASLCSKISFQQVTVEPQDPVEKMPSSEVKEHEKVQELKVVEKPHVSEKSKKEPREVHVDEKEFVYKEKMYPDIIEDIDMFEDKFDKIKRKCRSQAAAAKQSHQIVAEPNESHKARRKSEKKKGKKAKKSHVPTKGALKGFDGIKVSIPTSDINMSAIVPPIEVAAKKKKKSNSKKNRDKKDSESSSKYDSDIRGKDSSPQKKVDVYEFMDNEDAELFEFRPSTLMERFKNILNKDMPSTSKCNEDVTPKKKHSVPDEEDDSIGSASDGDDFVYMSDDYVCSDDETENSLLSCELGTGKAGNDSKKTTSSLKRKDVVEKNAVMGKIFKHNAVRTEKKTSKSKEPVKPKANLDQLFDSLLEDEPSSSTIKSDSPRKDPPDSPRDYSSLPASKYEPSSSTFETARDSPVREFALPRKYDISPPHKYESTPSTSKKPKRPSLQAEEFKFTTKKYDYVDDDYGPSTSKRFTSSSFDYDYGPSTSKKHDVRSPGENMDLSPRKYDAFTSKKYDGTSKGNDYVLSKSSRNEGSYKRRYSLDKSPKRNKDEGISTSYDYSADAMDQSLYDETGVARQRARRKCTVGKQNVLAESWSSESEPERGPPRPASAESVLSTGGRKKKGKKKETQLISGRKGNRMFRKQDESRVSSSSRHMSSGNDAACSYAEPGPSTSVSTGVQVSLGPPVYPGPSGLKPRPSRPASYSWTSEGDDEQEHLQQHGWIVGDSHKKLVTMLAHAKGRKRNSDDKRHLVE